MSSKRAASFWLLGLCFIAALASCGEGSLSGSGGVTKQVQLPLEGVVREGKEPMLMINDQLEPMAQPLFRQQRRDLYACQDMVAPWLQTMLVAELNFLADQSKLQRISNPVCLLYIEKDLGPSTGRFSVHFYESDSERDECAVNMRCKLARNVSLILKNQQVYRSYFLSDFKREKFHQHCVTPDNMWQANTTCYAVQ